MDTEGPAERRWQWWSERGLSSRMLVREVKVRVILKSTVTGPHF